MYCFSGNSPLQTIFKDNRKNLQQFYKCNWQAAGKYRDLQAADEIQYLQLTISIKNHREESVMKYGLEVASKYSATGLLCDLIITVLNTFNA